jgi:2-polyprenyl-3-methyl-5-hydroxy-6-metoxy-1,4-benzoquinol methylase
MPSPSSVPEHFDRDAARFDAIYDGERSWLQRLGDRLLRGVVLERFRLAVNIVGAPGRAILDVGCGSGRYGIELARRGAARCVGIDAAPQMIAIARRRAEEAGVAPRCEWTVSEWLACPPPGTFDAVIAMGYFDYLPDPGPHLEKMIAAAQGHVLASFPKRWTLRTVSRKLRFRLAGTFVRFYSRREVLDLFRLTGEPQCLSLVDLGRDYVAIYNAASAGVHGNQDHC